MLAAADRAQQGALAVDATAVGDGYGATAVLNLTGRSTDQPARPLGIRAATLGTFGGALTELASFSGRAYGQSVGW